MKSAVDVTPKQFEEAKRRMISNLASAINLVGNTSYDNVNGADWNLLKVRLVDIENIRKQLAFIYCERVNK